MPNPPVVNDGQEKRQCMRKVFIIFFICVLAACQPKADYNFRTVIIQDVGFRIPVEYYHPLTVPKNNSQVTSVLLEVLIPDIRPYEISQTELYQRGLAHLISSIMIESPFNDVERQNPRMPYREMVVQFSKINKTTRELKNIYGLRYLTRPEGIKMDWDEILFEGTETNPTTVLFCSPIGDHQTFPYCKMHFEYKGNLTEISFNRKHWLPHWKEIKQNTIKVLDKFHNDYLAQKGEKND